MPHKIPLIGDQGGSKSSWVSDQQLINMYLEMNPGETRGAGEGRVSMLSCPGTELLTTAGDGPIRGSIIHRDTLYVVSGNDFYEVARDAAGVFTVTQRNIDVDAVEDAMATATGPVSLASSGATGKQIAIVDGLQLYVYEDSALTANISAVTLANPGVVTANGHGLANGDEIRVVQLGTKATNSITGITKANPGVVSLVAHGYSNGDEVWLEGTTGMPQATNITVTVANATSDTFEILDTSGFDAAATAGEAYKGMRELNGNDYIVTAAATDTFTLKDIDTTGWSIYTSGGILTRHRWSSPGFATNTGDDTWTTFTSETNPDGTTAWANPSNASASDNSDATVADIGSVNTGYTDGTAASGGSWITSSGTQGWANPTNAQTSNDSDATVNTGSKSAVLELDAFGFSVPAGSIIDGIQ